MKLPNQTRGPVVLSKIDHAANMSEETLAFTATIEINGLRGTVRNDGRGGACLVTPWKGVGEAVETYAKTLPPAPCEWDPEHPIAYTADFLLAEMVGQAREEYEHRKMGKKGFTHYVVVGTRVVYFRGAPDETALERTLGAEVAKTAKVCPIPV